jgi:SAM-dependent methyltransferase
MKICPTCQARFEGRDWNCPQCGRAPEKTTTYLELAKNPEGRAEGFSAEAFDLLARLEKDHFWHRSRNQLILSVFRRHFSKERDKPGTLLEIGCGNGFALSALESEFPALETYGSEIHGNGLAHAHALLKRSRLLQMDAREIPFSEEFDVIGAFDVLEHIREDEQVLREIHKALKPGGGLIVTVPQHRFLWSPADEHAHHVRRYSGRELTLKMKRAGFEVLQSTSFVSLLFPAMLFSRFARGPEDGQFDPISELQLRPALNRLFERVMSVERKLIDWGCRFPAGGSRLVVARKVSRELGPISSAVK